MACACRAARFLECSKCGQVFCVAPSVDIGASRVFCEEGCDGELHGVAAREGASCIRANVFWSQAARLNWVTRCE